MPTDFVLDSEHGEAKRMNSPFSDDGAHDRVVRDSFTMPRHDYDLIGSLRRRLLSIGVSANKSQVIRAGLTALAGMSNKSLRSFVEGLAEVRPGRRRTRKRS